MNITTLSSSLPRVLRGAATAGAVLASVALISACGSTGTKSGSATPTKVTSLNTTTVASSIVNSIYSQRKVHAKVICPPAVPQEAGRTFDCTAETVSAKAPSVLIKTPFVVTIQNSKGYVTYVGK